MLYIRKAQNFPQIEKQQMSSSIKMEQYHQSSQEYIANLNKEKTAPTWFYQAIVLQSIHKQILIRVIQL